MQRIPYPELRAAVRIAERQFSQATKFSAVLLTGGRVGVEVWHGKSAVTFAPDEHEVAAEVRA
jgi:hypothetical protein